jgi:hypothetical protein
MGDALMCKACGSFLSVDGGCDCTKVKDTTHLQRAVPVHVARLEEALRVARQELEGIVHFSDGFAVYWDQGPLGAELRKWIDGARSAIAAIDALTEDRAHG